MKIDFDGIQAFVSVAELGGFTGLVEPDAETVRFLKERRGQDAADVALEPWMRSDPGAAYEQIGRAHV